MDFEKFDLTSLDTGDLQRLTNIIADTLEVRPNKQDEQVPDGIYPVDEVVNRLAAYIRHKRANLEEPVDVLIVSLAADIDHELRKRFES